MTNWALNHILHRLPRVAGGLRAVRYRARLARGESGGEVRYRAVAGDPPHGCSVTLCSTLDLEEIRRWTTAQTLENIEITDQASPDLGWFLAPGAVLPVVPPGWLQSALLVASTESIDALALAERVGNAPQVLPASAQELLDAPWRPLTLFSAQSYRWDPESDTVQPRKDTLTAKVIGPGGIGSAPPLTSADSVLRRGPYIRNRPLTSLLEIGLRNRLPVRQAIDGDSRPGVLVTAPFLARGGAEHTLFETLNVLKDTCRLAFATLAPHREELDDRRDDFESLSPHLFSLGDWVHPDAMMPMLLHLIDHLGIDVLYNANGTTLFYDFAPRLKAIRPNLRIIDHLYDHRVGYIERYREPGFLDSIDACIAENHPINEVLTDKFNWPSERAPVIWSCGRPPEGLPPEGAGPTIRRDLRHALGYADDDVVFLTAARMHDQKRPLDLVRLAEAVANTANIHFLIVGGGPMEGAVDRKIAETPTARIRRLPFRTDIPELILASDVGLLVSDFEGLPVFLLECLQLGRPFLGTDVGDLGSVLRQTGAGLVVETPGDIGALAEAANRLADEAVRRDFGAKALSAGQRFSPEHCARQYAQAFFGDHS
ncbi:MAG: glycosyltransferase family 4 protein [Acidobacteriota bacterium]